MFYGQQYLALLDANGNPAEVVNGGRLAQRLLLEDVCGVFDEVEPYGGCVALLLDPCTLGDDGETVTEWSLLDMSPAGAPWYLSSNPASAEAFGFHVEEWTGLGGEHHQRASSPAGGRRGGQRFGNNSNQGRVWAINLWLVGSSDRGLNYLFRWLEDQLLDCCSPCGTQSVWYRDVCPDDPFGDPEQGMTRADQVALLSGPQWEAEPIERYGCYLRRVSFQLGVGDPCLYRDFELLMEAGPVGDAGLSISPSFVKSTCATWGSSANRVSVQLSASQGFGQRAPIVTIRSPKEFYSGDRGSIPDLALIGYLSDSPCTGPLAGRLVLSGFEMAGYTIEVNMASRSIRYRDEFTGGPWLDGSGLLNARESGVARWWSIPAGRDGWAYVEPYYVDRGNFRGSSKLVSQWVVDISSVEFFGCC